LYNSLINENKIALKFLNFYIKMVSEMFKTNVIVSMHIYIVFQKTCDHVFDDKLN